MIHFKRFRKSVYRLMVCSVGLFLVFSILSCAYMAGSDVKKEAHKPRFNVGYQVLDFKHQKDGQEQLLTVAVWYPTAIQPKPHNYWEPLSSAWPLEPELRASTMSAFFAIAGIGRVAGAFSYSSLLIWLHIFLIRVRLISQCWHQ
ncbi:MAG: hypothetical protein KKD21_12515 [Proteobacteria bacterium]|nr:hypothetical protein [Pseudomonadota bacterium]MBU1697844.1 hypothetical protein [Pseudomonadota bacterium]